MEIFYSLLTGLILLFLIVSLFKIMRIALRKYFERVERQIDREIEKDYLARLQDLGLED